MFKKVNHVAVAVKNLDDAILRYTQVLGLTLQGTEHVMEQKVNVAMLPVGESRLELVAASDSDSPISKFIDARGEGIHHIALEVDDIDSALRVLKYSGIQLIDEMPRKGAGGAKIAFVHPKGLNGVLLELIEPEKGGETGKGKGETQKEETQKGKGSPKAAAQENKKMPR